jgi:hypothetical protein
MSIFAIPKKQETSMNMFDYESMASQAGLSDEQLRELCDAIRREFPNDRMLFELHVLRACMAIRDGRANLCDWLAPLHA